LLELESPLIKSEKSLLVATHTVATHTVATHTVATHTIATSSFVLISTLAELVLVTDA
jgi:hypothetical protein